MECSFSKLDVSEKVSATDSALKQTCDATLTNSLPLLAPVYVSAILLPTQQYHAFHVFRCGDYAAIIDFGELLSEVSYSILFDRLISDPRLLQGASEVELFLTHLHHDHYGYLLVDVPEHKDGGLIHKDIGLCVSPLVGLISSQLTSNVTMTSGHLLIQGVRTASYAKCIGGSSALVLKRSIAIGQGDLNVTIMVPDLAHFRNKESVAVQFAVPTDGDVPFSVLFTGDMEYDNIMRPFSHHGILSSVDFLVMPHHGSPIDCTHDLFRAIPFDVTMVPSGKHSVHFFDDQGLIVLARLVAAANERLYTHGRSGAFGNSVFYIVTNTSIDHPMKFETVDKNSIHSKLVNQLRSLVASNLRVELDWIEIFLSCVSPLLKAEWDSRYEIIASEMALPFSTRAFFEEQNALNVPFCEALFTLLRKYLVEGVLEEIQNCYSDLTEAVLLFAPFSESDLGVGAEVTILTVPSSSTLDVFISSVRSRGEVAVDVPHATFPSFLYHVSDEPVSPCQ